MAEVKAELLSRFIPTWGELALAAQREAPEPACLLVDFLAGAGTADGLAAETTGKILRTIFASSGSRFALSPAFRTFFSDPSKAALARLEQHVAELPFYPELGHAPVFLLHPDQQEQLREWTRREVPGLLVADPFGAKAAQAQVLQALDQASTDLFLLFEAGKLKASVRGAATPSPLQQLYGAQLPRVQAYCARITQARKREEFILQSLQAAVQERGYHTVVFKMGQPGKYQPCQYLFFASRATATCNRLKELLLEYSETQEDGVPTLGVNLRPVRLLVPEYAQYLPFSLHNLRQDLLQNAPQYNRLSLDRIYEKHNLGTPYCRANYLTVMEHLKAEGKILLVNPKTGQQVHKLTYQCLIKFKG
ncbi:hypothetical protein [Rufibacter psychrotolerans]|uniref:hypothetical protein n=1 Tax=Rufibacter psychrotolerans TaxID=2812556 RepID=UPI001966E5E3|nr:hypothetical protein [Rufibacter sp. SYSU D00308]